MGLPALPALPALPRAQRPTSRLDWIAPSQNYSSVAQSSLPSGSHFHRIDKSIGQAPLPIPAAALSVPPPIPRPLKSHVDPEDRHPGPLQPDPLRIPVPDFLDEDETDITNQNFLLALPPRPPNPELLRLQTQVYEKLKSELNSLTEALSHDAEKSRAHQADLLLGEPAIKDEMARLQAVRDVCHSVADRTRQAAQKAEANIAELRRKGDPEVDELVCATTIVHNQWVSPILWIFIAY